MQQSSSEHSKSGHNVLPASSMGVDPLGHGWNEQTARQHCTGSHGSASHIVAWALTIGMEPSGQPMELQNKLQHWSTSHGSDSHTVFWALSIGAKPLGQPMELQKRVCKSGEKAMASTVHVGGRGRRGVNVCRLNLYKRRQPSRVSFGTLKTTKLRSRRHLPVPFYG